MLLAPLSDTQTKPLRSIATPAARVKLPAANPDGPERGDPFWSSSVTLLLPLPPPPLMVFPRFAIQTLPSVSIARSRGLFNPPPVKPATGEIAAPDESSLVTLTLELFATHTLPDTSTATPSGPFSPPPV